MSTFDRTQMHVLGPGNITLNGVDAGYVSGLSLTVTPEMVPLLTAKHGKTPLDYIRISEQALIAFTLDQVNMTNYALAIAGAQANASGGNSNVSVGATGGTRMAPMIFTYIPSDSTIASAFSFTAWRVVPTAKSKIDLDVKQQLLNVELEVLVDDSKSEYDMMFRFGNVSVSPSTTPPTLSSIVPADDATVAAPATIVLTFSKALNPATVSSTHIAIFLQTNTGVVAQVAGTYALDATGLIVTFTPTSPFSGSSGYVTVVTNGVKDASNNAFAGDKYSFTTS